MTEPLILSTWSFGKRANAAGWPYLTGPNASSLDAVEQGCRAVESDPEVLSVGRGGCPDRSGEVSLDASIMLSPARCGSACYVRRFAHPVSIARLVMEKLRHVLLAGDGADRFAMRQGMTPANLLTDAARTMWQKWATDHPVSQHLDDTVYFPPVNQEECYAIAAENTLPTGENLPHNQYHDTVGVLAIDAAGQMAGACSTSGLPFKLPGRVGDSPIIGHGLYVDPKRGAAVTTGMGELVMSVCGSFLAVDRMGRGASPLDAAREVLERIVECRQVREEHQVAIIALGAVGPMERRRVAAGLSHGGSLAVARRTG